MRFAKTDNKTKKRIDEMKKIVFGIFSIVILFGFGSALKAQEEEGMSKLSFKGYLTLMPSVMKQSTVDSALFESLLHNRLNFYWYPTNSVTASVQMRNRLIYGDFVRLGSIYKNSVEKDPGLMDLSWNILSGNAYLLNSTIDRLWLDFTKNNLDVKIGRQRINWGKTFVWNPNDIFNTYNFFDFDYAERPGSDAVRVQYYTGMASSLEGAVKMDSAKNVTAAGLFHFNKWNYDLQFLAGYYNSSDYVAGIGWSGAVLNAGFRGEVSYFHSQKNFADTTGHFYASISTDYTFTNQLMLNFEFYYSYIPPTLNYGSFFEFYTGPMTVKNLAFTKYNFFGQVSYPITPLLKATLSSMYFYDKNLNGYYLGPSLDLSIVENLDLSLYVQFFSIGLKDTYTGEKLRQDTGLGFLRLKWNF